MKYKNLKDIPPEVLSWAVQKFAKETCANAESIEAGLRISRSAWDTPAFRLTVTALANEIMDSRGSTHVIRTSLFKALITGLMAGFYASKEIPEGFEKDFSPLSTQNLLPMGDFSKDFSSQGVELAMLDKLVEASIEGEPDVAKRNKDLEEVYQGIVNSLDGKSLGYAVLALRRALTTFVEISREVTENAQESRAQAKAAMEKIVLPSSGLVN